MTTPKTPDDKPRAITAQFPGKCKACGVTYPAGTRLSGSRADGWRHADGCPTGDALTTARVLDQATAVATAYVKATPETLEATLERLTRLAEGVAPALRHAPPAPALFAPEAIALTPAQAERLLAARRQADAFQALYATFRAACDAANATGVQAVGQADGADWDAYHVASGRLRIYGEAADEASRGEARARAACQAILRPARG